ncbi:MAG: hypothetical protein ACE5KE_14395 [Methanosarcinales archaeon]
MVNYTGPSVFASFKLELQEPSGMPDIIIQTNLFALKPGFYKNVTLSYPIPVNMWIMDGEYSFTGSLIDSFGNIIESDSVHFYINDSMPAKRIIP